MDFLNTLINGLSVGGIYAMIALGYTMVYGIAKMLNFAHGDIIMVGAYVIILFLPINPIVSIIAAIVFCAILGIVIEKIAYKPLRGASPLAVLITAIGVSYLLQSLAQIIAGPNPKLNTLFESLFPSFYEKYNGIIAIGSFNLRLSTLITLICAGIVMIALTLFVKKTRTGRAMVAVSEDKGAAQLMGINVNHIIMITFAIGSALAALASTLMMLGGQKFAVTMGSLPGIKAFTAAVIGGIGSIPGAMLGGIVLGLIECFAQTVPEIAPYTITIEFSILILVLLVKPTGFLGKKRREKV
ncbi:MAG: branched-chain amino acid ABC transporter permease [Clostridia bacterium]|nr:branched-chain amino acid ABC transporter permease [Clostridia bacterium]